MKINYANKTLERQCTDPKAAAKLFGGNKKLALSLLARINAIKGAVVMGVVQNYGYLHSDFCSL